MRGTTLVRKFADETIAFGGLPLRRADAARIATAWQYRPGQMDRFVWATPPLPDADPLPLTLAAAIVGLPPESLGTH